MISDATPSSYPPLLLCQIEIVRARRADVARLEEAGGEHACENLADEIANDLVGARIVIRAALVAPQPSGLSEADREALELREREAADLLRAVLDAPRRR